MATSSLQPSYVVGIGASAGGLEALERLCGNLPLQSGMAYVIVQHLSPDFKSLMDELLARRTEIKIRRVDRPMPIEPDTIYLNPPRQNLVIQNGQLELNEQDHSDGLNLPIDAFFHSMARNLGERAIAIVLSGTGSDGANGAHAVHDAGGLSIVQSIETAAFDGMPRSALAHGVAGLVCAPEEMPVQIQEYVRAPDDFIQKSVQQATEDLGELATIYGLFRTRFGINFEYYKPTTIERRLERRSRLANCHNLKEYLAKLESEPLELEVLYRDLLIEVTQFLRDPPAFRELDRHVIPDLVSRAANYGELRVWVPGCATGEEAYTLAMLLRDQIEAERSNVDLKVFATDVHHSSLETASAGVYAASSLASLPEDYRNRYFTRIGELFHINPELRQTVMFAPHDITRDPPFTRIDLISCRNVLIYLDPEVQKRVISLFHFGLNVGGVLFLGPSETVGDLEREFEILERSWRIFRKLRNVRLSTTGPIPADPALKSVIHTPPAYVSTATRVEKGWLVPEVYDHLLARYVPPSFLINQHRELVHSFGEARQWLVQPEGRATLDVSRMVEGDLKTALNAALHRADESNAMVALNGVRTKTKNGEKRFNLIAEPFLKGSERMYLICLEQLQDPPQPEDRSESDFDPADQTAERINELERELDFTRETLQATVEELETSNEELQSTNEELVASNEELQSTNEELHSVNEELYTVNAEHQKKITELTQVTNDMDNLLRSTGVGTVFLGPDLQIRKFTPAAAEAFHLLEQDIGRPISHIAHDLGTFSVTHAVNKVMAQGNPVEVSTTGRNGKAYWIRVLPYENNSESNGTVLTFIEISRIAGLSEHALQTDRSSKNSG